MPLRALRPQEIETLVLDIVERLKSGRPIEDDTVELKAKWPDDEKKAARQLAGSANAARGDFLLWIIGINERSQRVEGIDPLELSNWIAKVARYFDGEAPSVVSRAISINGVTVMALYFETATNAPFVINRDSGDKEVPWRWGTGVRSAKRLELLQLLVPTLHNPEVEVLSSRLSLLEEPHNSAGYEWHWRIENVVYITPQGERRIVIPYHRCRATISIEGLPEPILIQRLFFYPRGHPPMSENDSTYYNNLSAEKPKEALGLQYSRDEVYVTGPGMAWFIGEGWTPNLRNALPPYSPEANVGADFWFTIEIANGMSSIGGEIHLERTPLGNVRTQHQTDRWSWRNNDVRYSLSSHDYL